MHRQTAAICYGPRVNEADEVADLYHRHAGAWAAARRAADAATPLIEAAWLGRFLALLPTRPSVLDIGCGCGEPIGRALLARGCDLTGVDTSPAMIAMCQALFPRIFWHVADMRSLNLGASFNGLLAWDSFCHLRPDEERRMFAVFRSHALPRAALMFTSGQKGGATPEQLGGETPDHASLDPAEYRALLADNGFELVAHTADDPACGGHTVWLARLR